MTTDQISDGSSLDSIMMRHLYDKSTQTYHHERNLLLDRESVQSWDHHARSSASHLELRANQIYQQIREDERAHLFGDCPGEAMPGGDSLDMGGRFLINKDRIEGSRLFDIAAKMPKGCHLHVHLNSELPARNLLINARRLPETVFVRSNRGLVSPHDFEVAEVSFGVFPKDHMQRNLFTNSYDPSIGGLENSAWMKWSDFRSSFPADMTTSKMAQRDSGLDLAEHWALSKLTFDKDIAYEGAQTLNKVWAFYNQCTRAVKGLTGSESLYRWYVQGCIDRMVEDKIYYAEWRPMLMKNTIASDDGKHSLDAFEQMRIVEEVVSEKKVEWKDEFRFGIKIIYCAPRSIPSAVLWTELMNCIRLKQRYPDLICGFDLVGAEDRPYDLGHYAELLLSFQKTCDELDLDIPFLFHAGETSLDTGGTHHGEHSNVYDALLLRTKRIGHGISLTRHPMLAEEYKQRGIALEVCPISNELLHLCSNAKDHRLPDLLAMGLQCTINADNPVIFRSTLSHNFYQVMVGSISMTLSGCHQLVRWSIEHSCLEEQEKTMAMDMLSCDWDKFLHWIIEEHGTHAESLRKPRLL